MNLARDITTPVFNYLKSQVECGGKHPKGRRFSVEDKILALAFYKRSPTAYRFWSSIFAMPSTSTLHNLLGKIPISPGINHTIFEALKEVSKKMKSVNKYGILLFDEISLEPHLHYNQYTDEVEGLENFGTQTSTKIANHAQVYMLRGLNENWKQPVAYYFVQGGMKASGIMKNVKEIIRQATLAGLKVVATVCDQGSNNVSAINTLVKQTQEQFGTDEYVSEVDGERIIPLYDPPHLLKCVRDNLLNKNIHFRKNGKDYVAKWDYIYNAWILDGLSTELRAMPKFTEQHVNKRKVKKMKVSYAAQVFSHSVASTMNLLIGNDRLCSNEEIKLTEDARGTVILLKFFDDLFDSVNGSTIRDMTGKKLRTAVPTSGNSCHVDYWQSALPVLKSMYVVNNKGHKTVLPCFKNWQRTLKGLILLRDKLNKCGLTQMRMRRLNQDALENFFGKIRQRGQRNNNPTCSQFTSYYKSLLVTDLASRHSPGANCEDDKGTFLVMLQRFITQGLPEEEDIYECESSLRQEIPSKLLQEPKPLEQQAVAYVAGYIIKVKSKLSEHCNACKYNILKRQNEDNKNINCLVQAKEYGGNNLMRLKYCNFEFIKNLTTMYRIIMYLLSQNPNKHLISRITRIIKQNVNFNFIACEHSSNLLDTVITNFTKLVIFNYFNGFNKIISGRDDRQTKGFPSDLMNQAKRIYENKSKREKSSFKRT